MPWPSANQVPSGLYIRKVGAVTLPPSIKPGAPVIPISPPHVRVPIRGPKPAFLKYSGKASPPEPDQPLINMTLGPTCATGGEDQFLTSRTSQYTNAGRL